MYQEEKIIDLIITMIEQSNDRMRQLTSEKDKYGHRDYDETDIKLAQKEFEMQIKLLDRIVKNFKGGKGIIDITPTGLQTKEGRDAI
jgi:hypothetical protein